MPAPSFQDEIRRFYERYSCRDLTRSQQKHLARWWRDDRREGVWKKICASKMPADVRDIFIECVVAARIFADDADCLARSELAPGKPERVIGAQLEALARVKRACKPP